MLLWPIYILSYRNQWKKQNKMFVFILKDKEEKKYIKVVDVNICKLSKGENWLINHTGLSFSRMIIENIKHTSSILAHFLEVCNIPVYCCHHSFFLPLILYYYYKFFDITFPFLFIAPSFNYALYNFIFISDSFITNYISKFYFKSLEIAYDL